MNALWNKKDLERPANNVWISSRNAIDLKRFVAAVENSIRDLESQNVLHMEAAILSRLIYRMKSKFRNDKGLKNMEKVNRALLNYLEIKLNKEYRDLRDCVEPDGILVNLPTKQMIQYVLIRTQGFGKLMARIECVAKAAAEFFKARISIGHAWTISVIAYAVISRIWYLSRYLTKRCCIWYENMFEHVTKFREIGPPWLPPDYNLPESLKNWLDLSWIDQTSDSVPLKDDGKETIFSLIKSQIVDHFDLNVDNCEDVEILSKTGDNSLLEISQTEVESVRAKTVEALLADDIGTSVDRETFETNIAAGISNAEKSARKENASVNKKRRKPGRSMPDREEKRSKLETVSNQRKKVSVPDVRVVEKNDGEDVTVLRTIKSKRSKIKKESTEFEELKPGDIRTRDDLAKFLSKNSHPGLDRLQWNMMTRSIEKLLDKLERCGPSEKKREKILLKKLNGQIQDWIR